MFMRVFRGAIVGVFAALGAASLGADFGTLLMLCVVPIIVAMVDILVGEIFTLFVVFGLCSLVWTYTPVGKAVLNSTAFQQYKDKQDKKD